MFIAVQPGGLLLLTLVEMEESRSREFTHATYIPVNTERDEERCWITGMAVLSPDKLVLADSRNFSIKLIDTNSYVITNQLQLDSYPLDVTSVTELDCAVTVPVLRKILLITAASDALALKNELEVDGDCRGISTYGEELLVTYSCPAKLQIMDFSGNVIKTVPIDPTDELIFSEPYYVIANNNCIFVSDQGRQAVIRLNWLGEVTGSYKCEGCPHGLTLMENGFIFASGQNIYRCNSRNEANIAVNDLNFPYAVCWCNANRVLYISYHKGDEKNDNYLQVYGKA